MTQQAKQRQQQQHSKTDDDGNDDDDDDDDDEDFPLGTEEGSSETEEEGSDGGEESEEFSDDEVGEAVDNLASFCDTLAKVEQVNLCFPRSLKLPGVLRNLRAILHEMTGLEALRLEIFEFDSSNELPFQQSALNLLNQVLENAKHVKALHVTSRFLSHKEIKTIGGMSALTELELTSNRVEELSHGNGADHLSSLAGLTRLKRLRVPLSPEDFETWETNRYHFEEEEEEEEEGSMTWLAGMTDLVSLSLHVRRGRSRLVARASAAAFQVRCDRNRALLAPALAALKALEELELRDMGDLAISSICPTVKGLCRLRILDLRCCRIEDMGAEVLAGALCSLDSLTTLDVGVNRIGRAGAETVGSGLCALSALTLLDMSLNDNVGDEGASALAEAVRSHPALSVLRLSRTGLSDDGAIELADSLCGAAKLGEIDLAWNSIGVAGVSALVAVLLDLPELHTVNLGFSVKPESFDWSCGDGNSVVPAEVLEEGWAASLRCFKLWRDREKTAERHARSGLAGIVALRAEAAAVARARAQCRQSDVLQHVGGMSELYATMQATSESEDCAAEGGDGLECFARAVEGGCERVEAARKGVQESQASSPSAACLRARSTATSGTNAGSVGCTIPGGGSQGTGCLSRGDGRGCERAGCGEGEAAAGSRGSAAGHPAGAAWRGLAEHHVRGGGSGAGRSGEARAAAAGTARSRRRGYAALHR
eukprot:2010205-Rhodomonas_salina.2